MSAQKRKPKKNIKNTKKSNTSSLGKLRKSPKYNAVALIILVVGLIVLGYYIVMSRAATVVNVGNDLCGTWVLQQVSSSSQLNSYKTQINNALNKPGTIGLSVRFPWNTADISGSQTTTPILDTARQMVDEYNNAHPGANKQLAIRFMAGRHVPSRVLTASGVNTYTVNGEKVGVPWGAGSSSTKYVPNTAWINEYDAYVGKLAAWSRAHNVKLLHLSWWAQDWAELNYGKEVRAVSGFSQNNWLAGHKEIIDVGAKYAGNDLTVELPLSGYGPLSSKMSPALADYIISKVGSNSPKFFVQANGWGPNGEWGAPDSGTEAEFDVIWTKPIMRGLQMIQPQDYDWSKVYPRLTQNKASYAEVYLPSFSMASQAQLSSEMDKYSQTCGSTSTPPPTPTPTPTSTPTPTPTSTPTPKPTSTPTPSPNPPTVTPTPDPGSGPVTIESIDRWLAFDWVKGRYYLQLKWNTNGGTAQGYYLYARDNKDNPVGSYIGQVGGEATSARYYGPQPKGLQNDTTYTIRVTAVNKNGNNSSVSTTATTQCFWFFCSVR